MKHRLISHEIRKCSSILGWFPRLPTCIHWVYDVRLLLLMYVGDNLNGEDNYEIKNMEMSINTCVYSSADRKRRR